MTGVHSVFRSVYAQTTGVVFAGRNSLDFLELRLGVVRIPEVSLRIREAQNILESLDVERVDLLGATVTEDEYFFRNIKIKSLLSAIVQVGLYDRLLRSQRAPDILVGNSNGDSALLVCAGQMTFESMVKGSSALQTLQPLSSLSASPLLTTMAPAISAPMAPRENVEVLRSVPMGAGAQVSPHSYSLVPPLVASVPSLSILPSLAGLNLTEFRAFIRADDGTAAMIEVGQPVMDLRKLLIEIVEHQGVARFINIGPGLALATDEYEMIGELAGADEVTIIDSIDLDPMLSWFWRQMRPVRASAQ